MDVPLELDQQAYAIGFRDGLFAAQYGEMDKAVDTAEMRRRKLFATGVLVSGLGAGYLTLLAMQGKYRSTAAVFAFSTTMLGAVFSAVEILTQPNARTPGTGLKVT